LSQGAETPPKPKRTRERPFIVFRFDGHAYHRVTTVTAKNRDAALDQHINKLPESEQDGAFVAVLEKAWKLRRVKVETARNVSFTDTDEKSEVKSEPAGQSAAASAAAG
jgi:hypothetical protein